MRLEKPVTHLLVDLDGTLLGNRPIALGYQFAKEALGSLSKYGGWRKAAGTLLAIQRELERRATHRTNDLRVVELFSRRMNVPLDEARKVLRESLFAVFPPLQKYFYPIAGAAEFLDWAKERFALTLATNPVWPTEIVELRVRWAGIDPSIFSFITDARKMTACKPAREYFEGILRLQNLKPEECLLVGNDFRMDVPATRSGIPVFVVGNYARLEKIRYAKAKAPAWKGTFKDLKHLLETLPPLTAS